MRFRFHCHALFATVLLAALSARAETSGVSPSGFVVNHVREVQAAPAQIYAALGRIGQWWSSQHTWSGKAENLRLELAAGACFCERWGDHSVEHGRVIRAQKDSLLRLAAQLGPLQELAVNGILTFAIASKDGKNQLTLTYRVAGAADSGLDQWAQPVDRVLGQQVDRLLEHLDPPPTR
jgi:uncharacterized protein YndB with AHSA1/START domain